MANDSKSNIKSTDKSAGFKQDLERWNASLTRDVADDVTIEVQLLVLAMAAGILDATTFPEYGIFVSNQTGNTALLAVGALGLSDKVKLQNVGFSLGLFIIGGMVFGQLGDRIGSRRKAWLIATNVVQTMITAVATALRKFIQKDGSETSPLAWPVIALLAFASGGQVAMARTVNLPQIPTAMVTSAYIDFLADPDIMKRHNRPRNRRLFFVLSLIIGSFIGAIAYAFVAPSFSLLLATICKTLVCLSFLFNREIAGRRISKDAEPCVQEGAAPEQETQPVQTSSE